MRKRRIAIVIAIAFALTAYLTGGVGPASAAVGPAHPVADPVPTLAADAQDEPAVAFDGTNHLVVWQDHRSGPNVGGIWAARVTPAGTVIDPTGIPVSTVGSSSPAVAFDGTNYLVVWQMFRGTSRDIVGSRVSPSGAVLDRPAVVIGATANEETGPRVASDGTDFLVVWTEQVSEDEDIFGARVSPGGSVLDRPAIAISTDSNIQLAPDVASDGNDFLVVWQGGSPDDPGHRHIRGARVSRAGVVLDSAGTAVSTATGSQSTPAVAFDGTRYLVVWQDGRSGSPGIYGARVTKAGTVLDGT